MPSGMNNIMEEVHGMKRILALVLTVLLALSCLGGVAVAEEKARVAFICKGYQDTYCLLVMNIFKKYVEETYADQFTVDYFDGETNADKITQLIETCTASKYNVIIMQQQDADAPVAAVKAAKEAGIPVVVTVGSINDGGISYYLDANPEQQGSIVAQYAIDQGVLKKDTKVAILQGPAGQFHSNGRTKGYNDAITKVGANKLAQEICEWQKDKAQTCVENWLVAYPDLEVILACNDDMALGAIEAMKLAGNDKIYVVGVDANEEGCLAIKAGTLKASVAQDTMGYAHGAADFASKLLKGEPVESKICDSVLITKENVDDILLNIHGYTADQIKALG
jgi:ABC-type sugar transport system substrate-binding protein